MTQVVETCTVFEVTEDNEVLDEGDYRIMLGEHESDMDAKMPHEGTYVDVFLSPVGVYEFENRMTTDRAMHYGEQNRDEIIEEVTDA